MHSGDIADLSVRGMGVRLPTTELTSTFTLGKTIAVTLHLPDNRVRLEGKIRSIMRAPEIPSTGYGIYRLCAGKGEHHSLCDAAPLGNRDRNPQPV
jgi:hypothetical protein